ncbi:amidohydrolase [Mucilaginibacter pedocola]|uniref:Amidohydrolase n=2 Tax=Mucilaginibacter pedocola TaxID=1792845 RepID=A0A1S9PAA8_9SPHI|nr:amidohydrolase [Mucilaginibacter pedocola]
MQNIPVVDAHLHLWDPQLLRYPWLDDVPMLNTAHLIADYNQQTEGIEIERMVFVQCECEPSQCEQEAAWVTGIAKQDKRIQGIIPWAPLELGEGAKQVLDRMAQNPLIKGIRRIIQFEADADFCLRPGFVQGVQLLPAYNWSFDICVAHHQLPKVIELVRQCPNVAFMLDHFGKPDIRNWDFMQWEKDIEILAQFSNVDCKLSGLVTEADFENWTAAQLKPYVDAVLKHFGPDRLIFGGDWPVVRQASTYKRWKETADELLAGLSHDDRYKIYNANAVRFYKLDKQ